MISEEKINKILKYDYFLMYHEVEMQYREIRPDEWKKLQNLRNLKRRIKNLTPIEKKVYFLQNKPNFNLYFQALNDLLSRNKIFISVKHLTNFINYNYEIDVNYTQISLFLRLVNCLEYFFPVRTKIWHLH